jgi:hypothetical protein
MKGMVAGVSRSCRSPGSQLAILVGGVKAPRASTAVTGTAQGLLRSWFVTARRGTCKCKLFRITQSQYSGQGHSDPLDHNTR